MKKNLNILAIIFTVFAFIGFADTAYLTLKHYLGTPIPCSIFGGCDLVTNSAYSQIGPVPLALLGTFYYLTLIILSISYFDSKKETMMKLASYLTVLAFFASLFLVYLQFFVIKSICLYCMVSAITTTILFVLGQFILKYLRSQKNNIESI